MTKTAFLFPGQGSQSVGMLAPLALQSKLVTDTFAEAAEVLGYDLWAVVQNGPEQDLNRTEITQPAMLVAGVACWRAWRSIGGFDRLMAGWPEVSAGGSRVLDFARPSNWYVNAPPDAGHNPGVAL
jgi:malonyl CoA-acyl carrier protein transacylase